MLNRQRRPASATIEPRVVPEPAVEAVPAEPVLLDEDEEERLVLEPEDLEHREVESFGSGIRIVEMQFSHAYRNQYESVVKGRVMGGLVARAFIFEIDRVAVQMVIIIGGDIDLESEGWRRCFAQFRRTYGLHYPKLRVEYSVGGYYTIEDEAGDIPDE